MDAGELQAWVDELRALLDEMKTQDFGFSLGDNVVREPATVIPGLPPGLEPLYAVCDGITLEDVHVGYFIDRAERTATSAARGEPTRIVGGQQTNIAVFGTDGGGGRFAIDTDRRAILYLSSAGAVVDGAFLEDQKAKARIVASSLGAFLRLLLVDVEAFVHRRQGHVYLAR